MNSFRFGVVATPGNREQWIVTARRIEELGYGTLFMPDGLGLLAPFPSLAVAATVTTSLRVGTYVLASPLRPPGTVAWEARTLTELSGGRFELGLGTGHGGVRAWTAELGLPYGDGVERLARVADTVERVRALPDPPAVLVAAGGPKALALAGQVSDTVALAAPPVAGEDTYRQLADAVRAGGRQPELAINIALVGDADPPPWVRGHLGADVDTLREAGSWTLLRGTPEEMAAELRRRREVSGVSCVTVNGAFAEQFAPVVELLRGT